MPSIPPSVPTGTRFFHGIAFKLVTLLVAITIGTIVVAVSVPWGKTGNGGEPVGGASKKAEPQVHSPDVRKPAVVAEPVRAPITAIIEPQKAPRDKAAPILPKADPIPPKAAPVAPPKSEPKHTTSKIVDSPAHRRDYFEIAEQLSMDMRFVPAEDKAAATANKLRIYSSLDKAAGSDDPQLAKLATETAKAYRGLESVNIIYTPQELARIFHLRFWPWHFFASVAKFVILSDCGRL